MIFLAFCAVFFFPHFKCAEILPTDHVILENKTEIQNMLQDDLTRLLKDYTELSNKNHIPELDQAVVNLNLNCVSKKQNLNLQLQNTLRTKNHFHGQFLVDGEYYTNQDERYDENIKYVSVNLNFSLSFVETIKIFILENNLMATIKSEEFSVKMEELLSELQEYCDAQECFKRIASETALLNTEIITGINSLQKFNSVSFPDYLERQGVYFQAKIKDDLDLQYENEMRRLREEYYNKMADEFRKIKNLFSDDFTAYSSKNFSLQLEKELSEFMADKRIQIQSATSKFSRSVFYYNNNHSSNCNEHLKDLEFAEAKLLQEALDSSKIALTNWETDSDFIEISKINSEMEVLENKLNECETNYLCYGNLYQDNFVTTYCYEEYYYRSCGNYFTELSYKTQSLSNELHSKRLALAEELKNIAIKTKSSLEAEVNVTHSKIISCIMNDPGQLNRYDFDAELYSVEEKIKYYNSLIIKINSKNLYKELSDLVEKFKLDLQEQIDSEQNELKNRNETDELLCFKNKNVFDNLIITHSVQVEYNSINDVINKIQNEVNNFNNKIEEHKTVKRLLQTYWSNCKNNYNAICLNKATKMLENVKKSINFFTNAVDDTNKSIDLIPLTVEKFKSEEEVLFKKNLQQLINETRACLNNIDYTNKLRNKIISIKDSLELGNKIVQLFNNYTFEKELNETQKHIDESLTESLKVFLKIQHVALKNKINVTRCTVNSTFDLNNLKESCLNSAKLKNFEIISKRGESNFADEELEKFLRVVQDVQFDLENCGTNSTCLEKIDDQLGEIKYKIALLIEGPKKTILDGFEKNKVDAVRHCNDIGNEFVYCLLNK